MFHIDISTAFVKREICPSRSDALEAAARGVSNLLIAHLRDRNRSRPAKTNGMPKSNYYADAARSVTTSLDGSTATVSITKEGINLHLHGGTVRPDNGHKALAIPVDPSVAAMWPSEAGGKKNPAHALVWPKGKSTGRIINREDGRTLWVLVPQVTIPADPTVLPSHLDLVSAAINAVRELSR